MRLPLDWRGPPSWLKRISRLQCSLFIIWLDNVSWSALVSGFEVFFFLLLFPPFPLSTDLESTPGRCTSATPLMYFHVYLRVHRDLHFPQFSASRLHGLSDASVLFPRDVPVGPLVHAYLKRRNTKNNSGFIKTLICRWYCIAEKRSTRHRINLTKRSAARFPVDLAIVSLSIVHLRMFSFSFWYCTIVLPSFCVFFLYVARKKLQIVIFFPRLIFFQTKKRLFIAWRNRDIEFCVKCKLRYGAKGR